MSLTLIKAISREKFTGQNTSFNKRTSILLGEATLIPKFCCFVEHSINVNASWVMSEDKSEVRAPKAAQFAASYPATKWIQGSFMLIYILLVLWSVDDMLHGRHFGFYLNYSQEQNLLSRMKRKLHLCRLLWHDMGNYSYRL